MKQNIILYLTIIILIFNACEKEYFPDEDAYRDSKLFGTWLNISEKATGNKIILEVYTSEGYCGSPNYIEKNDSYTNLGGIWYSEKFDVNDRIEYKRIQEQNRFRKGMYQHTIDYYIIGDLDTLIWRYGYYSENEWDTLVKYKYQLIYDGPEFVGIDSTSNNNN